MQNNIIVLMMDMAIRRLKKNIIATPRENSQAAATKINARLNVTTCLYLNPERRARSLHVNTYCSQCKQRYSPKNYCQDFRKHEKIVTVFGVFWRRPKGGIYRLRNEAHTEDPWLLGNPAKVLMASEEMTPFKEQ